LMLIKTINCFNYGAISKSLIHLFFFIKYAV
jgi:hypothetical protein